MLAPMWHGIKENGEDVLYADRMVERTRSSRSQWRGYKSHGWFTEGFDTRDLKEAKALSRANLNAWGITAPNGGQCFQCRSAAPAIVSDSEYH